MKSFTCRAVETKLHRYIADIRLGPVMFLLNPNDASTEAEAYGSGRFHQLPRELYELDNDAGRV